MRVDKPPAAGIIRAANPQKETRPMADVLTVVAKVQAAKGKGEALGSLTD
jgi:Na+/H+-translocating membrane pyrophosphatase